LESRSRRPQHKVLILEERDANKRSHHSCVCIVRVAAAREIAAFAFVVGTRPHQRGAAGKEGCGLRARSTARAGRPLEPGGPLAMAAVSIKARERAAGVRLASVAAGGAGPREWWEHLALSTRLFGGSMPSAVSIWLHRELTLCHWSTLWPACRMLKIVTTIYAYIQFVMKTTNDTCLMYKSEYGTNQQ
jgi:hypothetical protein